MSLYEPRRHVTYLSFRLVNAPAIEAAEIVEKLGARDAKLGLALTSLRKLIRVSERRTVLHTGPSNQLCQEDQFANEFLQRDGLNELIDVISTSHGNILAVSPLCLLQDHP